MGLSKRAKDRIRDTMYVLPPLRLAYVAMRFRTERALLHGRHTATSESPSLITATLARCGSMLVAQLLRQMARRARMPFVDLASYHYFVGRSMVSADPAGGLATSLAGAFRPRGYVYAPIRDPAVALAIPDLAELRVLLLLRDPRDVTVSWYHAFGQTHSLPVTRVQREKFATNRLRVRALGPDAYALSQSDILGDRYRAYLKRLLPLPNVMLLRLEDFVADAPSWIERIVRFAGLPLGATDMAALVTGCLRTLGEKRDHRSSVGPETWEAMTAKYRSVLDALGYRSA